MPFQSDPKAIRWYIHLNSSPEQVYAHLSTNDGRAAFWAESAMMLDKHILFCFPDGQKWRGKILEEKTNSLYKLNYVDDTTITFELESDGNSGTILTLTDEGVKDSNRCEATAGLVTVLLSLKADCDFGIDLRNHDSKHTWNQGYVDN
jgi:hypothetical protein